MSPSADPWTVSWNSSHGTSGCGKDDLPKTGGARPFYSFAADWSRIAGMRRTGQPHSPVPERQTFCGRNPKKPLRHSANENSSARSASANINRPQIQNLFHLNFVAKHANVVFISGVGLGKSHLMTDLGYAACQRGHAVLFTGAIDIINTLATTHAAGGLKKALAGYVKPEVLCIDELGYLPIDKVGADCLFQIISHRYERGAALLTSSRIYKQ